MSLSRATAQAFYGARSSLREAQELAVAPVLAGDDVLVIAGTGSGKTEAVVAPVVDRHLSAALRDEGLVTYLYLSPTKALANDMAARLEVPLSSLHVQIGRRHGDRNDLARKTSPPQFLITTPESLDIELVKQHPRLRGVRAVIVDEVHQLAGTQRGLQLCMLLLRLERWLERPLQVTGMSATLADPEASWRQIRPERRCTLIQTVSRREREVVLRREQSDEGLSSLLAKTASAGKVLVFARSRGETEAIASSVGVSSGFGGRVYVHHSSLDVSVREQVEHDLKGRDATLCVATSTLELGIDIGDINLVVLVGAPPDWRSLEQRIGRTNRRGDRTNVIGVVPPKAKQPVLELAYFLGLLGQSDGVLAREERPAQLYGALAQQAVSIVRQAGEWVHVKEVTAVLSRAPGTTDDDAAEIVQALVDAEVLQRHAVRNMVGSGPDLERLVDGGEAWGNFPASSQSLNLFTASGRVGEVPMSPHNAKLLQPGRLVAFRGRVFAVERLVRGREVHLRPASGKAEDTLKFGGNAPVRDPYLVRQLPAVLRDADLPRHLGTSARAWWDEAAPHLTAALGDDHVPYWRAQEGFAHATFGGLWINHVLLALQDGHGVAGEAVVHLPNILDQKQMPAFEATDELALKHSPRISGLTSWQKLLPPRLLGDEVLSAWRTDPVYRESWERLRTQQIRAAADERLSALG